MRQIREAPDRDYTRAIYVPTERPLYSELTNPAKMQVFGGPSTFVFFAKEMAAAKRTLDSWSDGVPDTEPGEAIRRLSLREFGGEIVLRQDAWKWRVTENKSKVLLNIDMASSGQKANWTLLLLSQTLFSWRDEGRVARDATIYVEEPEIHLYPSAQCAVVEVLAMLVRQGFRVVLTTHSLTVLYKLNNLIQAGRLSKEVKGTGLPPVDARLAPQSAAAYMFGRDGNVRSLINDDNGFIDEAELGQVSAALQDEMNHISGLLPE